MTRACIRKASSRQSPLFNGAFVVGDTVTYSCTGGCGYPVMTHESYHNFDASNQVTASQEYNDARLGQSCYPAPYAKDGGPHEVIFVF